MDPKRLFLLTLKDIEAALSSDEGYDVLRASGLVRQMLLDGAASLVDTVNREYRLPIRFRIVDSTDTERVKFMVSMNPTLFSLLDGLDPTSGMPGPAPIEVSRDRFLKQKLVYSQSRWFTVHDIIDHCAHVLGGVHLGTPKSDSDKHLHALQTFQFGVLSLSLMQLRPILRVTVNALSPLAKAIEGEQTINGAAS